MAIIYLRSTDGSDADDGSTWALAKATLAGAYTAAAAGDTIYVSHVHAETQASGMTLTSPGTVASPCRVLCANDGVEPPTALAATGTISTSAASITFGGYVYYYGLQFQASSAATSGSLNLSAAAAKGFWFDTCILKINNTNVASVILLGSSAIHRHYIEFRNTVVSFGSVSQSMQVRCPFVWLNTPSAVAGTVPTTLFKDPTTLVAGTTRLLGVDLSALGSGKNLFDVQQALWDVSYYLQDCKLGSSVSITTGSIPAHGRTSVELVNCDAADTNYRYEKHTYHGVVTQETVIVRTGGATDGVTPISYKLASSANSKLYSPLESPWISFWNETIGSAVTVSIPIVTDNVTLTDAEAWIEVEGLTTSGFPLGGFVHDRAADILATPANQATDGTSTWTTTGLGTPVKQVLSTTITPQEKGIIRARVRLAKASTTLYFDPLLLASSGRQFMAGESGYVNQAASAYSRSRLVNAGAM